MLQAHDVYWIAGILEGEGSFTKTQPPRGSINGSIQVTLAMQDTDVIFRFANLLRCGFIYRTMSANSSPNPIWRWGCQGTNAAGLMMTVHSLMGNRRQAKIEELLAFWKSTKAKRLQPRRAKTFDPSLSDSHYCA